MLVGLSIVMAAIAYSQALSWLTAIILGLAIGVGIPINGSLSGSFFKRMIDRGLM